METESKPTVEENKIPKEVTDLIFEIAPEGVGSMKGIQVGKRNLLTNFYKKLEDIEYPPTPIHEMAEAIVEEIERHLDRQDPVPQDQERVTSRNIMIVNLVDRIGGITEQTNLIETFNDIPLEEEEVGGKSIVFLLGAVFMTAVTVNAILDMLRYLKIF